MFHSGYGALRVVLACLDFVGAFPVFGRGVEVDGKDLLASGRDEEFSKSIVSNVTDGLVASICLCGQVKNDCCTFALKRSH